MKIIMNYKEIEIKLQIDEDNYYRLLALMESTAAFQSKKHQVDIYYSPENESYYDNGDRCLRIRSENNKSILSYKRINGEGTSQQYIEEYETCIESQDMMNNILKALNYRSEIIVDKDRKEYCTADGFLVALDVVENLGFFVEIENRNREDVVEKQNKDLVHFVGCLGLDMAWRNSEGYSNMLYRKNCRKGE